MKITITHLNGIKICVITDYLKWHKKDAETGEKVIVEEILDDRRIEYNEERWRKLEQEDG